MIHIEYKHNGRKCSLVYIIIQTVTKRDSDYIQSAVMGSDHKDHRTLLQNITLQNNFCYVTLFEKRKSLLAMSIRDNVIIVEAGMNQNALKMGPNTDKC